MNQTLTYPTPTTFRRITGLCNRPLLKKDTLLPNDPRLDIVSGIDLTSSVEGIIDQLKSKVEEVETVDIVFFCGKINSGLVEKRHPNALQKHTSKQTIFSP